MRIEIQNIGAIHHAEFILKPITLVCGQSDTGKSVMLDSIAGLFSQAELQNLLETYGTGFVRVSDNSYQHFKAITLQSDQATIGYSSRGAPFINPEKFISVSGYNSRNIKKSIDTYDGLLEDIYVADTMRGWFGGQILMTDDVPQLSIGNRLIPISEGGHAHLMVSNIMELMSVLHNVEESGDIDKTIVFCLKNPENMLSNNYIRRYLDVLLGIRRDYQLRGFRLFYVIETTSPVVLNHVRDRVFGTGKGIARPAVKLITNPNECVVYGMKYESSARIALTGTYRDGFLEDWETGFLTR